MVSVCSLAESPVNNCRDHLVTHIATAIEKQQTLSTKRLRWSVSFVCIPQKRTSYFILFLPRMHIRIRGIEYML